MLLKALAKTCMPCNGPYLLYCHVLARLARTYHAANLCCHRTCRASSVLPTRHARMRHHHAPGGAGLRGHTRVTPRPTPTFPPACSLKHAATRGPPRLRHHPPRWPSPALPFTYRFRARVPRSSPHAAPPARFSSNRRVPGFIASRLHGPPACV